MKKIYSALIIICSMYVLLIPNSVSAMMQQMTNDQLGEVTGQAGLTDYLEYFGIHQDSEAGIVYFGGKDDGYFSVADITYDGSVNLDLDSAPVKVSTINGVTTMTYDMSGISVDINNFSANLLIGPEPGKGNSFGTLHVGHFSLNVHGSVQVSSL